MKRIKDKIVVVIIPMRRDHTGFSRWIFELNHIIAGEYSMRIYNTPNSYETKEQAKEAAMERISRIRQDCIDAKECESQTERFEVEL